MEIQCGILEWPGCMATPGFLEREAQVNLARCTLQRMLYGVLVAWLLRPNFLSIVDSEAQAMPPICGCATVALCTDSAPLGLPAGARTHAGVRELCAVRDGPRV